MSDIHTEIYDEWVKMGYPKYIGFHILNTYFLLGLIGKPRFEFKKTKKLYVFRIPLIVIIHWR